MREIKFRAWGRYGEWEEDGENQKYQMLYGDTLAFEEYAPINELLGSVENLMQYTGLKDKNGKEVYEGDIVIDPTDITGGQREWIIAWDRGGFEMQNEYLIRMLRDGSGLEIIGNIYENSELLEK